MTRDLFLEDVFALIGLLCLLSTLAVIAAAAVSYRRDRLRERRRAGRRTDWSSSRPRDLR